MLVSLFPYVKRGLLYRNQWDWKPDSNRKDLICWNAWDLRLVSAFSFMILSKCLFYLNSLFSEINLKPLNWKGGNYKFCHFKTDLFQENDADPGRCQLFSSLRPIQGVSRGGCSLVRWSEVFKTSDLNPLPPLTLHVFIVFLWLLKMPFFCPTCKPGLTGPNSSYDIDYQGLMVLLLTTVPVFAAKLKITYAKYFLVNF